MSFFKKLFGKSDEKNTNTFVSSRTEEDKKIHAVPNSFDKSAFYDKQTNLFKFPKYKTSNSLVKIKDYTDYRADFWFDYSNTERENYSIEQFENDFISVDIEIELFWIIFSRLKKEELSPYGFLKNKGGELNDLIQELEDEISEEQPYLFLDNELKNQLLKVGYLEIYSFKSVEEKSKYEAEAENLINTTTLRDIAKANKLKSSLTRDELIIQFKENNVTLELPKPVVSNSKFDKMMERFAYLYINDIKKSIDDWHPLYFQEIWEMVALESEYNLTENMGKQILSEKYWSNRFI